MSVKAKVEAEFGRQVRARRDALGLTRKELAHRVGCSIETIRKIESGERHPSRQIAELLAKHLDIAPDQQPSFVQTARAKPTLSNLPTPLTSFIGREKEITELTERVKISRLVMLTGAGGVGKSRLAQQVAAQVLDQFEDGAWLVELASTSEPTLVADTVASTLGLRPTSRSTQDVLTDYLYGKHLLLILDNCEHLIHTCAELVEALLQACPHLHTLATSRELLNILSETTWRVPSLAAETAMQLFVDRARAARPDFKLDEQNAAHIMRICEQLDGIPLAIELAAARLRAFSVEQIAARLDDRFQLLTDGSRTALPRHRTLRAMIDWSYGLLSDRERELLRRVSVFAGGWTLEAAEAIYGSAGALDSLAQLVNKSLVTMEETPTGARYGLHETIRQHALEKLVEAGEQERTRQRHLDFFTCMADEAGLDWHRAESARKLWLDRIQADLDNFRTALERTVQTRDIAASERLINGLWQFWRSRSYFIEGINWINALLINPSQPGERAYAVGRTKAGFLSFHAGDNTQASVWLEEAMSLAHALDDRELMMLAAQGFGFMTPNYKQSIELETEAIRLAEELDWADVKTDGLFFLGRRMRVHGDYEGATRVLMDCVRLIRDQQDINLTYCLWELGLIANEQGDYAPARIFLEESIVVGREWGDSNVVASSQLALAEVALNEQREEEVVRLIKEAITPLHKTGNLDRVANCLSVASGAAQACDQLALAVRWLGVASVIRRDFSSHTWQNPSIYAEYERRLTALREVVTPAEFDRAWAEGERMTLAQAVEEVLAMDESTNRERINE